MVLGSDTLPSNTNYYYLATDLDDETILETYALVKAKSDTDANLIKTLTAIIDAKTQAFADSEGSASETTNPNTFDILDERLLN